MIRVNGRFLTQRVTGVQRYATELVRALDRLAPDEDIAILAPPGPRADLDLRNIRTITVGRTRGQPWEQLELPLAARGHLLFSPCNTGPALVRNQVVTIHDAAVFEVGQSYSWAFRTWYRLLQPWLCRQTRMVITGSEFSRACLQKHCGATRVRVIPLGHEHILHEAPDPSILPSAAGHALCGGRGQSPTPTSALTPRPYLLAVSSAGWHKNFSAIEQALRILGREDLDVLVAGGRDDRIFSDTATTGVRYLGYVTDAQLRALYENATCLVHPSLHEGFGFPPLEAMAAGCPVLASRAASLPEVCGDAVLYCDQRDPGDLAARLDELLRSPEQAARMRAAGLERAARFTWEACAKAHLDLFRQVLRAS